MSPESPSTRPCCACGATSDFEAPLRISAEYSVARCANCGVRRTDPLPDNTAALYQEAYYSPVRSRRFPDPLEWVVRWFRWRRAVDLHRRFGTARALDVGCGRALTLYFLREKFSWDVQGTQVSASAHAFATETLKVPVFLGELPAMPAGPPFQVASMFHVLEHLPDPVAYLRDLHRRLAPGGALVIEVPNAGGFSARISGSRWLGWDVPHHLCHFDLDSLREILSKNGFRVDETKQWSAEFGPFMVLQSGLSLIFRRRDYLLGLLQGKSKFSDDPISAAACLTLAILLAPAATIVAAITAACGMGEVIRVYARKTSD